MVRDKRVAERVEHDEAQNGTERCDEKNCRDFNGTSEEPSGKGNQHACGDPDD